MLTLYMMCSENLCVVWKEDCVFCTVVKLAVGNTIYLGDKLIKVY